MPTPRQEYGPEVQYVPLETPVDDIIYLLKRDGAVFVKALIAPENLDKAYEEIRPRLEASQEWEGAFFPKETQRATNLVTLSATYTRTQMMNPLFRELRNHLLTTRTATWVGEERKEFVAKPYLSAATALRVGPGAKAQPLHRDDPARHSLLTEISEWDDERDSRREMAMNMMVAGTRVTKQNGATRFIPKSHLWAYDRETPPDPTDCVHAEMEKGDALIFFCSVYHGAGNNTTTDEFRLLFATSVIRGIGRQEENQYLAVPPEKVREYDREIQRFIGYHLGDPFCGHVNEADPICVLYPELKYSKQIGL